MVRAPASIFLVLAALLTGGTSEVTAASPGDPGVTTAGSQTIASAPAAATPTLTLRGMFIFGTDLALDRDGHRHVVATSERGDLWYATDRTGTWASSRVLLGDSDQGLAWTRPSLVIDEDGRVHIAVVKDCAWCAPSFTQGIWYLTDKDRTQGTFGTGRRVAGRMMTEPSLRVVDGVMYLAYQRCLCSPGDTDAPLWFKTDRGGQWTKELVSGFGLTPSLRVGVDGRARIAFEGRHGLRYAAARTRRGSFAPSSRIPGSAKGQVPSLALGPGGQPQVAWVRFDVESRVRFTRRIDSRWGEAEELGPGSSVELSIDEAGRPHVLAGTMRRVVHRWRRTDGWERRVIADGIHPFSVDIRAYGRRASIAWAQEDAPRGVWITRD